MATLDAQNPTPVIFPSPRAGKRKRRWPRILLRSAGILLALLVVAACVGTLWLRSAEKAALPVLDGELHLPGLSAPVTVERDAHGVPHIAAATQHDLFFAQGYVTAQDRLWQMDAFRRNADGDLAQILGPSLLRHDKTQRTLQFRRTAQQMYAGLDADNRARLDDYASGVNLFIAQHHDSLPAEFRLLMYRPEPWTGVDSLSIVMMMVEMLDTHFYGKLGREQVAAALNNPKLEADLYPVGSWRDHPPTGELVDWSHPHLLPPGKKNEDDDDRTQASAPQTENNSLASLDPSLNQSEVPAVLRQLLGLPVCDHCAPGSNNWVVAGSHTASGKPLLSNDMHLGLTEPNIWFMADLRAPGYHAAGVTLPGLPFVVEGHNEHVAWGFTALYADVQDLYLEKLDGKGRYQAADGSWKPLAIDREVIHVRGAQDVTLDVQLTAHGPLLNPLFTKEKRAISLQWTLYDPALYGLPLYEMNVASGWDQFSAALRLWSWPTQNLVYSDDQGHIAYHAIGKVPLRPAGLMGVPIKDTAHEWQGYIPFGDVPHAFDPPSGFLATANSNVTTSKTPYPLSLEWIDPYRAERIYKALQGRDQLTPKDMLAVQTDVYSEIDQELAHRFAYAIDHTPGVDDRLKKAANLMRSWDGRLSTDSVAASVNAWTRHSLWPLVFAPRLGKAAMDYEWAESDFATEEIVMHANPDWLPKNYKNWDALLTDAVRRGMKDGKAPSDLSQWTYGSWHVVDIEHPLAGYLPFIGRIAGTGPQPLSGDDTTVKQVARAFGPSQRFTMDWSNIDGSTENIVLGESSDPYSPYYRDQWSDYQGGRTFALPFTPTAVTAQTTHTLRLVP
ncbi:MAG: penicillin acylase family protein [Terracidiphilus sp.]|jgi:penicillin amidase